MFRINDKGKFYGYCFEVYLGYNQSEWNGKTESFSRTISKKKIYKMKKDRLPNVFYFNEKDLIVSSKNLDLN